jgi:hypothetical protein
VALRVHCVATAGTVTAQAALVAAAVILRLLQQTSQQADASTVENRGKTKVSGYETKRYQNTVNFFMYFFCLEL